MYPHMSLFGIDISRRMVEYAREQAATLGLSDQVEFHVMDALHKLEFPSDFFDLVNLRLGSSWIRKWNWPELLLEMLRITCPSGVIRLTEGENIQLSPSEAHQQFCQMLLCALFRAGHFFEQESTGITAHLAPLLKQHGCLQVQEKQYALEFKAGTSEMHAYIEDSRHVIQTFQPFLQKWGCLSVENYKAFRRKFLAEIRRDDFHVTWNFLTAWGNKPDVSKQVGK